MSKKSSTAISPTREEDYPEWYQQVVRSADFAENSPVRGCMVIKPWGYGTWENLQREIDTRIKATGHQNAYFPLFIPLSFLEKEAEHVEGFAKECAVVTHHRLEEKDGKLVPAAPLEEPLVVRPTSETIIGETFAGWVQSYRDLPLLINQWANVVRWEMRPRLFLRTAEFLWQEGHTVHATEEEAMEETLAILEMYREVAEDVLLMPVIVGEKSEAERFPGAVRTFCIESMMQDRKALQAGTSHYLGQNFAKAAGIKFLNQEGEHVLAHTTSWGVSTRLIGGMIMTHGDDNGLRLPPKLAPQQIVLLPVIPGDEHRAPVMEAVEQLATELKGKSFAGMPLRVTIDDRDLRGGEKSWQWIKRGIPLRVEIGPRDLESGKVALMRRDEDVKQKHFIERSEFLSQVESILESYQTNLFEQACRYRDENVRTEFSNREELLSFFSPQSSSKPEIHGGFARVPWCDEAEEEEKLAEYKLSVRCLPLGGELEEGQICLFSGKPAKREAILAKAY